MNFLTDILSIILQGLGKLSTQNLILSFGGAAVLAVACFLGCNYYSRLWNKTYQTTVTHKMLSATASVLTFIFIMAFLGLTFLEEVAQMKVTVWTEGLKNDDGFVDRCFKEAYYQVKALDIEDFSEYPTPEAGGRKLPTSKEESKLLSGTIYSNLSCEDFKKQHTFLSLIANPEPGIAPQLIKQDIERVHSSGNDYMIADGINIAAQMIKNKLEEKVPRVVSVSRILLTISFILIQAIPFSLIGFAAYKDLKIKS